MEILTTLKMAVGKAIVGALLTLSGWAGMPLSPQNVGADTMQYVGGTVYRISGSGISSSATSIPLTSLTLPQNGYPLQDSDFASTFYLTLEPGDTTKQEFASCTTVGANTGGAVTLSGCTRGLSPISPYTASTTLQFTHAGGTKIIFSNSPQFYDQFTAKGNDESITGIYTFSASPIVPTPTTATQAANKTYVDNVTNAGAATSTESNGGIVELGTLAEQESSYDGGSTKPTVLQTKNSTSSCQVIGSYNIVASSTTGKLDGNCFNGAYNYSFTASTTMATTTKIGESYGGLSPVGSITAYASTTAPAGWLLADGTSYTTAAFPNLFGVIGYSYGGSGANFNVPNLKGRNILMASTTANVGQTGGESNHTQTIAEMPSHTHTIPGVDVSAGGASGASGTDDNDYTSNGDSILSNSTGSGTAFNVLDPYFVLQYIIKY